MDDSLLERYRRDRRKLLEFILSSPNLITETHSTSGSSIDLDSISVDYVLRCMNSGGVLDFGEAIREYYCESAYPPTISSQSGTSFFIASVPKENRSPRHKPPSVDVQVGNHSGELKQNLVNENSGSYDTKTRIESANAVAGVLYTAEVGEVLLLGLPSLRTGLSDDDLRESAYEVLIASMVFSGVIGSVDQGWKKGRTSKLIPGLKNKDDKVPTSSPYQGRDLKLSDTIRMQMQVSEMMDLCIRRILLHCLSRGNGQRSLFSIPLSLLDGISSSHFLGEKQYVQWQNRQANILDELLGSSNHSSANFSTARQHIQKIRNSRAWDKMPSAERAEVIVYFRNHASKVSSLPEKISDGVESCFEASCYHLRFRLYEKLLSSVFDVLEEGQIMEEANEILKLVKLTWPILGVSQIIHDVLYAWVLLKQFVKTDELLLLEKAILQVQQVLAAQPSDEKEIRYLGKLLCTIERDRRMIKITLVPAILLSMRTWCGTTLEDYHRHYGEKPSAFSRVMTLEFSMGDFVSDEYTEITKSAPFGEASVRRLKMYIERSVKAAYDQASNYLDRKSESINSTNPLVLLADALMLVAEKERNVFYPVLHQWYSDAGKFSATLLYQKFNERLKPFLEGISGLSQDVRSVLAASHMLDLQLTRLYAVTEGSSLNLSSGGELDHFQVARISSPLILDWIMGKNTDILQWIGRAFDLEDWEPVSSLQKQAVSIIEVLRMIDETVHQFFKLNLPVNTTHLQGLLSVIVHSIDAYLSKVTDSLVEKSHIYPPVPSLTRYEERVVAIVRKKHIDPAIFDEKVNYSMTGLTVSKLCTRLNTLKYVQDQVGVLEETIRKSWGAVKPLYGRQWSEDDPPKMLERTMDACNETVDELFVTTFDSIRNNAKDAMSKIYDIFGVTVVFWDLRDSFIYDLYRGSVEGSRIDHVLQKVDGVLNQICNLVDNTVRDAVVSSIFRAFVEGYVWVLLDGGPSRAFSENDITLLEDDLNTLKDFFVADGEGLGRSLVEQEASFAQQVVTMFSNQTGTIIQGLMNASERTPGQMQSYGLGNRSLVDADVLIRVLCHKKDREASKFLKSQYRLPKSSEYEETSMSVSSSSSSIISDLMNRSASLHWTGIGHSSSIPSKKQNQTSTNESPSGPSIMSDLLNRSKSLRWTETRSSRFRSLRNKLHL